MSEPENLTLALLREIEEADKIAHDLSLSAHNLRLEMRKGFDSICERLDILQLDLDQRILKAKEKR